MAFLSTAVIFLLGLFSLAWLCQATTASLNPTLTQTAHPNPTTCYTAFITPKPSGISCDVTPQSLPAKKYQPFTTLYIHAGRPRAASRDACLETKNCLSYGYSYYDHHRGVECRLYNQTLAQLGVQNPPNSSFGHVGHFFDRKCYTVKCHTTTGAPSPVKTCTPSYTDLVRDPSFESRHRYWHFLSNASLVTDDPKNAASGNNYVRLDAGPNPGPKARILQTISGLKYGDIYFIRFLLRTETASDNPCDVVVGLGGLRRGLDIALSPFKSSGYQVYTRTYSVSASDTAQNLNLVVSCSNGPATLFLDDFSFTNPNTSCPFKIKIQSIDNRFNGDFFVRGRYDDIERGSGEAEASVWELDQFGYVSSGGGEPDLYDKYLTVTTASFGALQWNFAEFLGRGGPVDYLRWSIDSSNTLRCGSRRFLYCLGPDETFKVDFIDGPYSTNSSVVPSHCSPISLEVVYV